MNPIKSVMKTNRKRLILQLMNSFNKILQKRIDALNSNLCVGLDIAPEVLGVSTDNMEALKNHAKTVVDATRHIAVAFKPNLAFFERYGSKGFEWLEELVSYIGTDTLIIGDAKRGDIGNTARQYAESLFNHFKFDAVTVNPYMGGDTIDPFMDNPEKGVFLLCRTSNPTASEIQGIGSEKPVYIAVAEMVSRLNKNNNLGLVVGATATDEMKSIRNASPGLPFLIPGIGAQGGDLKTSLEIGNTNGCALINVSRSIIYAGDSSGPAIQKAAEEYVKKMRMYSL